MTATAALIVNDGGFNGQDRIFQTSATVTDSSQVTLRLVQSELTLGYQGSTTVSGSVAAVRGNTTILTGTTITGASYIYGTQGKITIKGTHSGSAEVSTGILGQLDLSSCTAMTAPLACLWGDCGASVGTATGSHIDIAVLYNTIASLTINSAIRIFAYSTYLFDLSDPGSNWSIIGTAPGTLSGSLKVKIGSNTRYLALYTSPS